MTVLYVIGYVLMLFGAAHSARHEKWGAFTAFIVLMIIAALAAGGSLETFHG